MPQPEISIFPILGLPEIVPGCQLSSVLAEAVRRSDLVLKDFDILVIAHKVISKAEGRIVQLNDVEPSKVATIWAEKSGKDARLVELSLREASRIVRMER
ncbi:MAG TPA: coenzyme F420-0:L-glutamate ligase, partial [Acidobacteriota bacterium]|nr:coenzyme F420-0:L-glutamate ligase [Acidobacteriota bacterium]